MPPRSGPWDTQEERRRLDAEWPWTTVIHRSSEQREPWSRTRDRWFKRRGKGEVKWPVHDEAALEAHSSPALSS